MLRQMLVAVDFSVWGRYAAGHACDVAQAIGGTVTLLHVLEPHESGTLDSEVAHTLLQELSLLARRPPSCLIVPVSAGFTGHHPEADSLSGGVDDGIAPAILAVADRLDAELIVIGLHGQGNPTARTLGRVAQQVLSGARVPVQVVPCPSDRSLVNRWAAALAELANR